MYAQSLTGPWFVDLEVAYNCSLNVAQAAGGASELLQLSARQRPTLLLPQRNSGQPPCPVLFTGASTAVSQYQGSFTMQQALDCSEH